MMPQKFTWFGSLNLPHNLWSNWNLYVIINSHITWLECLALKMLTATKTIWMYNLIFVFLTSHMETWKEQPESIVIALLLSLIILFLKINSLNLLGWHWLSKLYRFQLHDFITHQLCTVLYVHRPKSSLPHHHLFPLNSSPPPAHSTITIPLSMSMRFFSFLLHPFIPSTQPLNLLIPW